MPVLLRDAGPVSRSTGRRIAGSTSPMRTLIVFLSGLLLGAALFHLYYREQAPAGRCRWDHPIDHAARSDCEARATFKGYARDARDKLDSLIGNVGG